MKRADRRGRASDLLPPPPLIPAVHQQDEGSVPPCIRRPPLHPLVASSPPPTPPCALTSRMVTNTGSVQLLSPIYSAAAPSILPPPYAPGW